MHQGFIASQRLTKNAKKKKIAIRRKRRDQQEKKSCPTTRLMFTLDLVLATALSGDNNSVNEIHGSGPIYRKF